MPFKKFQIFFTLPQTPAPFCPSGTKTANPGMPVHSGGEASGTVAPDFGGWLPLGAREEPPQKSPKLPRPKPHPRVLLSLLHPRPEDNRTQISKHQRPTDPHSTGCKSPFKDSKHSILRHRLHNPFPKCISKSKQRHSRSCPGPLGKRLIHSQKSKDTPADH